MNCVGVPLRGSINPLLGSDVAPVPGIARATTPVGYSSSGHWQVGGRWASLPAGNKEPSGPPCSVLAGPAVSQSRFVLLSWSPSPTGRLDS